MGQLTHLSRLNSAAALGDGAASRCHRAGRRGITPGIRAAVPGCLGAYPAAPRFHARCAGHPAQAGGAAILKHPGLSPPVLALTTAGDVRSVTRVSLHSIFVIQCSQTTCQERLYMPIAIIVQGGAGNIDPERVEGAQEGCREAALVGWNILQAGGSALDAVEAAVRALEDNPMFNAGTGACLTSDGNIELDAGIMEGYTLRVGAVAGVELIKNPVSLARKVLESPHVLLVGKGAQEFAQEQGMPLSAFEDLVTERQYRIWLENKARAASAPEELRHHRREVGSLKARQERHGTVGAAAVDITGTLAAATSTGGIHNKYPGRVGDSPLVGCGFYADENAAVSCTGYGEDFIRLLIAKRTADFVGRGDSAREAAEEAIALLSTSAEGMGGLIVVDRKGDVGFARNSQNLAYACMVEGMAEPMAGA